MAQKLKNKKIVAKCYRDIEIKDAVKDADLCFIGGEIINSFGAIAKTGTQIAAEISRQNHTPVYVCTHSLKYDPHNEIKTITHKQETTTNVEKTLELLSNESFFAYLCEYGVLKPEHIKDELKFYNPWMFI